MSIIDSLIYKFSKEDPNPEPQPLPINNVVPLSTHFTSDELLSAKVFLINVIFAIPKELAVEKNIDVNGTKISAIDLRKEVWEETFIGNKEVKLFAQALRTLNVAMKSANGEELIEQLIKTYRSESLLGNHPYSPF